jgi:hypothetical protein
MPVRISGQIASALEVAREVLASRFSEAEFAIVAGSIMRGQGTFASDIDLVVVFDRLEAAWRESFVAGGFPVEAFVHDPETLKWFVDQDVDRGYPSIVNMIAEGHAIGKNLARATALRAKAEITLSKGPAPLTAIPLDALRYEITDLLDDLRGERTPAEIRAIAAKLHQPLADLILLGRGVWTGRGKWIPRQIDKLEGQLLPRFEDAFRLLAEGRGDAIIAFAEGELERHGGSLFAGYRRVAPANARRAGCFDS